ncbi:hypothetical protein Droror1_Dr00008654 [Drosera rotundifolia]
MNLNQEFCCFVSAPPPPSRPAAATSFATHHCLRNPILPEHLYLVPTTPLDLVFTTASPDLVPTAAKVAVS